MISSMYIIVIYTCSMQRLEHIKSNKFLLEWELFLNVNVTNWVYILNFLTFNCFEFLITLHMKKLELICKSLNKLGSNIKWNVNKSCELMDWKRNKHTICKFKFPPDLSKDLLIQFACRVDSLITSCNLLKLVIQEE